MERKNCWEVMKCGRQTNGEKVEELGACPAAESSEYNGTNRGMYAGRFCWAVAGTLCGGKPQGAYAEKFMNCLDCKFLKVVTIDEGRDFILSPKNKKKPD